MGINMKNTKTFGWLVAAALLGLSLPASAQDGAASGTGDSGGSGSSISLELQGRLPVLNIGGSSIAGVPTLRGDDTSPPATLPAVTAGVRLLDQRLFVGVGIGWYGTRFNDCTGGGGGGCVDTRVRGYQLTPTVTYDVLVRGPARLYPIGMLSLGTLGRQSATVAGITQSASGDFWLGMNLGAGIRADFADGALSIGSEWGWGFARTAYDEPGGGTNKLSAQGAWGTVFFAARLGL